MRPRSEAIEDMDQKRRSRQRSEERPHVAGTETAAEDDDQYDEQTNNQSSVFQPFHIRPSAPFRFPSRASEAVDEYSTASMMIFGAVT